MKTKLLVLMPFSVFFALCVSLQTVVINIVSPVTVHAAAKDDAKKKACADSNPKNSCEDGFEKGYNKQKAGADKESDACGSKPVAGGKGAFVSPAANATYHGCTEGFQAAKADKNSGTPDSSSACKDEKLTGNDLKDCEAGYLGAQAGEDKDDVCKGKGDSCKKGFDLYQSANDQDKQVNCDATLTSTLSWIACPLIDMGVAMTDFIFRDFVQPMLENVPVSTDPDDGSFKAWKQFRLLANILLIGSLMMIVYSQAKGGGGGK